MKMNATENREKSNMKTCLAITMSLAFVTAAARAQTLPSYVSVIDGESPYYYNQLGTGLAPSVGNGTFVADGSTGFTNDYFGNANDASYFTTSPSGLLLRFCGTECHCRQQRQPCPRFVIHAHLRAKRPSKQLAVLF